MELTHDLNDAQLKAVTNASGNMLVLAGAGSGKTRVLTHRIAWLVQQLGISPYSILAVTFTNKAAGEMRGRIEAMLNVPVYGMWVGTFHGLAHRLLRSHWQEANLPEAFQILDSEDQFRLIKRVQRSLDLDDHQWPPKQTQWFINGQKDNGLRPEKVHVDDYFGETMVKVYKAYQAVCENSGLIDFAELLLRSYELLEKNTELRKHYQQRFTHILVDEFQDTNTIQYLWLKLLTTDNTEVMIVGDDDQSIYGWRGAKIDNIHRFNKEFKNTSIVRLEENYRSTKTILTAANAVIENNDGRLGKNLWTQGEVGDPILIYQAFNDLDEARFIVQQIKAWLDNGHARQETAILYRSNAQSRVLEEALLTEGLPYRVYGGMKFFERAEIKDALGYLRLIGNRDDDAAFERVVNMPTRGVGHSTLNTLRQCAREYNFSLWQAAQHVIAESLLPSRAINALKAFLNLINELYHKSNGLPLEEQSEYMLQLSGLMAHYRKDKSEKGMAKVENLEEFVTACKQYEPDNNSESSKLTQFLSHVALETGETQGDPSEDCVQLMTLHTAKGLEFPFVILAGMEEGLFPHYMSAEDPKKLEEERRLCYVGMTRAKDKLLLTHAERRRTHGNDAFHMPSRFIREIPSECINEVRMKTTVSRPSISRSRNTSSSAGDTGFRLGQRVSHTKFGDGIILNYEGQGTHARIQVQFKRNGTKWLVMSHARLQAI